MTISIFLFLVFMILSMIIGAAFGIASFIYGKYIHRISIDDDEQRDYRDTPKRVSKIH